VAQPAIQTAFSGGEWSPDLFARVDIAKYHSAAQLLRNFYVDYRGGASTRAGFRYILQARNSSFPVRLIPFQASFTTSYVLEFGQNYLRFISNGAYVLEAATTITGASQANPGVITDVAHGYVTGDWVYITGVVGMTQLNGNYYIVVRTGANTYTLTDLNGNAINTTGFGAYISGGQAQRVYTITTPYLASDLALVKFAQNVQTLILCHPNYNPQVLTLVTASNWTLSAITFGPTIAAPGGIVATTTSGAGGGWNYAYLVTALDINNQESAPSVPGTLSNISLISSAGITNTLSWNATAGAVSYNVYKALGVVTTAIPSGAQFGFIGNTTALSFNDAFPGIAPDFSQTPPIIQNPFLGASVTSITLTAPGGYSGATVPLVTLDAPGAGGIQALAYASLITPITTLNTAGGNYVAGDYVTLTGNVVVRILTTGFGGTVVTYQLINPGSLTSGVASATITAQSTSGIGNGLILNANWVVGAVILVTGGSGYTSVPVVHFSGAGGASAIATVGAASAGNPSVPGFFQQRLVLASQPKSLQSFNMSVTGSPYNFNITDPIQANDAISASITSGVLNQIKSLAPVPAGLIMFTNRASWLVNGGSIGAPVTPSNITANAQSFNGANDVPPIISNFDVLYVQSKGAIIRDLSFNFYAQIYTGTDITVMSSHLFYGFLVNEWAWAEEPFKVVWAVRSDGALLSLTFQKEQEMTGWAHSDTQGLFKSICTVTEQVSFGAVDAIYCVIQRLVNGNWIQYIERMAERIFPYGMEDAWCVDAGLQTTPSIAGLASLNPGNASGNGGTATASAVSGPGVVINFAPSAQFGFTGANVGQVIRLGNGIGVITAVNSGSQIVCNFTQAITQTIPYVTPAIPIPQTLNWSLWTPVTTVGGLSHLIGQNVVGLADGVVVGQAPNLLTVNAAGSVTLANPATKITLGLAYSPQLQTLRLDLGEPTAQGKRKSIIGLTVRTKDTLGLAAGKTLSTVTQMKDFQLGQLNIQENKPVTNLYTGDGRVVLEPQTDTFGNYYIVQPNPLPATILGLMPEVVVGDTK
jgi:hypothetical protein